MNPKAKFGKFRSKLRCIVSSALRDCSTCQIQYASLSELEFHNKKIELNLCQVQKKIVWENILHSPIFYFLRFIRENQNKFIRIMRSIHFYDSREIRYRSGFHHFSGQYKKMFSVLLLIS